MPRIKKLTDYTYSPTNPASEDAIRAQIDDAIQEVYDFSTTSDLISNNVQSAIEEVYSKAKAVVPVLEITEARTSSIYGPFSTLKERTDNSDVKIRELVINVKDFGAKGDGITDDSNSIQSALDLCKLNGGGVVYFPDGKYITSKTFSVPDSTTIKGNGITSWIHNNIIGGDQRILFMFNNFADARDANGGILAPSYYTISSMNVTTLTLSSGIENFSVGDVVIIISDATFPGNADCRLYEIIDEIIKITGTTITLKYGYKLNLSTYPSKIAKINTQGNGWNDDIWLTKKSRIENLKLSHGQNMSSGMYVIFAGGFECEFKNLTLIGSTLIGSNVSGHCVYENIQGTFDAGCFDSASLQCDNVFRKIIATRVGNNVLVNNLGFVINNGKDNFIENCEIDFSNIGSVSSTFALNPVFYNNVFKNCNSTNSNNCLEGCSQGKSVFIKNKIINVPIVNNGIFAINNSVAIENEVYGFDNSSALFPFSFNGSVLSKDNISPEYNNSPFPPYTKIKDLSYDVLPASLYKSSTTYISSLTDTTIVTSKVYKKTKYTTNRHIKILIHGIARTKLGTANLKILVGASTVFTKTFAITQSDLGFVVECDLIMPGQGNLRYVNRYADTTFTMTSGSVTINATASDIDFSVAASIADATLSDWVAIDGYSIEYFE